MKQIKNAPIPSTQHKHTHVQKKKKKKKRRKEINQMQHIPTYYDT